MFEKIDIGIKTFLRDAQLFNVIDGIERNYPDARMIIVDDGDQVEEKDLIYAHLNREGHIVDVLPFDSGFGRKSNRVIELSSRPYVLIGSDDFCFDEKAAQGLLELQNILDINSDVDIASGRVNNQFYEFYLDIDRRQDGLYVEERSARGEFEIDFPLWYHFVDLTVNYSLIRRQVFEKIRWDDEVKIGGGEHGSFFVDCKLAGFKTAYVQGVNINEQQVRNSSRYNEFRNRARSSERPCFVKRNIRKYVLGDGRVDYEEK